MPGKSRVILAGAGPGDESLVTIKLVECLKIADVILVDRLVNRKIIDLYANPGAEIILVGKEGYSSNSTSQNDINALLVKLASQGLRVVRLKGGDVAIYSNVLDEIRVLQSNKIEYEIIPGITAASGIAASLNIPLTGRDIAPGVQIHSFATNDSISEEQYMHWATTKDTLVFYMSTTELNRIVSNLILHGAPDKRIAIVEQGSTPFQVNTISTLSAISELTKQKTFQSPTLIIIGNILGISNIESSTVDYQAFFTTHHAQNNKLYAI